MGRSGRRGNRGDADGVSDAERAAFGQTLRSHDPRLRRLVWRMVNDADLTDDVLQESYLRAFRSRSTFTGTTDGFGAWLYRITYNTCIDHLRAVKRQPVTTTLTQTPNAHDSVSIGDRVTTRGVIRAAVSALSPEQAAAVVLVDLEGMSYAETAEVLDISIGTLSSRVNRGRAALRDTLGTTENGWRGAS